MAVRELVGYMPEHDCLPLDVSGTDFVTHMGQISGLPFAAARERAAEMLRHVGLLRGALSPHRQLLDRHEAARQARPGARPRSQAAAARRADERPRSRGPRGNARRSSSARAASSASPSW